MMILSDFIKMCMSIIYICLGVYQFNKWRCYYYFGKLIESINKNDGRNNELEIFKLTALSNNNE